MSTANDGGPAFPVPADMLLNSENAILYPSQYGAGPQPGMTLLDWFAGQALAGFVSVTDNRTWCARYTPRETFREWQSRLLEEDAEHMYAIAAAMLRARQKAMNNG